MRWRRLSLWPLWARIALLVVVLAAGVAAVQAFNLAEGRPWTHDLANNIVLAVLVFGAGFGSVYLGRKLK